MWAAAHHDYFYFNNWQRVPGDEALTLFAVLSES